MDDLTAFKLWNVVPPPFINALRSIPGDQELLVNGNRLSIPWPFLTPQQIVDAFPILDDWDVPRNLIPIAGDFHSLLCIDIENGSEIVFLSDSREVTVRFSGLDELLNVLRSIEPSGLSGKIIESKSWLDF